MCPVCTWKNDAAGDNEGFLQEPVYFPFQRIDTIYRAVCSSFFHHVKISPPAAHSLGFLSLQHDGVCLLVFVSAVLAVLSALPVSRVQPRALKQAGHERQALSLDVRLSGEEVEHRVGTAADEGYGGGDGTTPVPYFAQ